MTFLRVRFCPVNIITQYNNKLFQLFFYGLFLLCLCVYVIRFLHFMIFKLFMNSGLYFCILLHAYLTFIILVYVLILHIFKNNNNINIGVCFFILFQIYFKGVFYVWVRMCTHTTLIIKPYLNMKTRSYDIFLMRRWWWCTT